MADPTSPDGLPEGLRTFVSRRLMDSIIDGTLPSGQKLSPVKLAAEFGVSHIPVREALSALEADGYVDRIPRVGFFVAELSLADIEDVYHWRQVLEDEAHRMAVPKLKNADLARMRKINDAINETGDAPSNRFLDLNREFHFVPFERAGSDVLLRFLNHLWDSSARYLHTMDHARSSRATLREHHDSLLEAFEAKDVTLVNARMAEHRAVTLRAIRKLASSSDKTAAAG